MKENSFQFDISFARICHPLGRSSVWGHNGQVRLVFKDGSSIAAAELEKEIKKYDHICLNDILKLESVSLEQLAQRIFKDVNHLDDSLSQVFVYLPSQGIGAGQDKVLGAFFYLEIREAWEKHSLKIYRELDTDGFSFDLSQQKALTKVYLSAKEAGEQLKVSLKNSWPSLVIEVEKGYRYPH